VDDLRGVRRHHRHHHVHHLLGGQADAYDVGVLCGWTVVTGLQNGWAIAGDYLSAASFLGIAGLISLYGYDGFMYSVGWLVAYITVLLVIAEPCRNIGNTRWATSSPSATTRRRPRRLRRCPPITVSTFYLTAQMVGGGVLIKTLIGIDYHISVIGVAC